MVAVVEAATAMVVTVKVALVAPAGMVRLPGTDAAAALLESETAAPPLGAGAFRVAVPVEADPPVTLVGASASADSVGPTGATGPSAQNSKKLRDHPLPSPTLLVSMRRNLACALSASSPVTTGKGLERVTTVCRVTASSEIWIE